MMDLREVAKLVADALELEPGIDRASWWAKGDSEHLFHEDGRDIAEDYWRCRCEEWLHERGQIAYTRRGRTTLHEFVKISPPIWDCCVACPLAEAPARLVAEVWQRMKEHNHG